MEIIDPRIEEYVERLTTPHDPLLAELSEETARELGMPQMLTGPVAGRLLEFLVWTSQPQRVVEIGTFSGHSALSMAALNSARVAERGGAVCCTGAPPAIGQRHNVRTRYRLPKRPLSPHHLSIRHGDTSRAEGHLASGRPA